MANSNFQKFMFYVFTYSLQQDKGFRDKGRHMHGYCIWLYRDITWIHIVRSACRTLFFVSYIQIHNCKKKGLGLNFSDKNFILIVIDLKILINNWRNKRIEWMCQSIIIQSYMWVRNTRFLNLYWTCTRNHQYEFHLVSLIADYL
jgi:hypothetical protein